MTRKAIKEAVDYATMRFNWSITAIAGRVYLENVLPLCRRKGWTFSSGMGVYSFYDREGMPVDESRHESLRPIWDMLAVDVMGRSLGTWVKSVNESDLE